MNNLYQELELSSNCSFEDIKHQYRILAKKHHPDMGGDAEKFKKIKLAYEVLSDPKRRAEYDKTGKYQPPPNVQNEARQNLAEIFYSRLKNFNPNEEDLVELIKTEMNESLFIINNEINDCNAFIEKMEIVKSKIFIKDIDNENLFFSFIDSHIQDKLKHIKFLSHRLTVGDEILRILRDYHYGFIKITNQIIKH